MKLKAGDKVKLNKNVKKFKYGKGGVGYDEIGTITEIDSYNNIYVNFPTLYNWMGVEEELVLADRKKFFKKLPNNFTGTLEVENGFIVEKEILDETEKKYLNAVIRPFKDKVKYIEKTYSSRREYIGIKIIKDSTIILPYFEKETMYKGMEVEKKYTLKELGLDV